MKTKFNGVLTLFLALIVQISFAQEKTISGNVSDDSGPLPGVSVLKKGTKTGTETNFDGQYSIKAKTGDVLVFSFVGMKTIEKIVGSSSKLNIKMFEDSSVLEEVVVNALGIRVDKSKLSSSISKVKTEDISKSGENNLGQALSGKASGVQVINSSGDAGASAYIQIRGQSTITRSVQPLIVIDGIPVSSGSTGNTTSGVAQQSRLNDINPEDIQDLQILKGASAAALWGSRAGNGVIVITTKKGRNNKNGSFTTSITSSFSFDTANKFYPLQDKYGKGSNGVSGNSASTTGNSWGDRISNRSGAANVFDTSSTTFFQSGVDGSIIYPTITRNSKETFNQKNIDAVFRTGLTSRLNLSIGGRSSSGSTHFFSISRTDQEGIIRNNTYKRITARYNAETKLGDRLKAKGSFSYSNIDSERIQQGSNTSGLLLGLYRTPTDFDNTHYIGTKWVDGTPILNSHRSYRREGGTNRKQTPIYNNPLWTINKQRNPNTVHRYIAGAQLEYKATDWLNLIARGGLDNFSDRRQSFFPINSSGSQSAGFADESTLTSNQINIDFIANSSFDLTEDINMNILAGFNLNERQSKINGGSYQDFILDSDKIFYGNSTLNNRTSFIDELLTRTSAGYSSFSFDYKNILALALTGRLETASTFASGESFFYPSAEFSYKFGNETLFEDSILSNGKLRLTYGQVGQQPAAYSTITYSTPSTGAEGWGPAYSAAAYDGSFSRSAIQGNPNLKPEIKEEFEIGLDLSFFNDKLTLNTTYYQNESKDVLMNVAIAPTSGFNQRYDNAASLENKGIEIDLGIDIIKSDNFDWSLNGNWSMNRNKVTSLSGTKSLFLNGFTGSSSRAVEGEPLGVLWGGKFARDNAGEYILDSNGFPTVAPEEGIIGDPNPDWRASLGTSIRYKNFTLSTLFDSSFGGDVWDGTGGALNVFGRTLITANEVTVSASEATAIVNASGTTINNVGGAVQNADGTYTVRGNIRDFGNGDVLLDQSWYSGVGGGFGPVGEQFIKPASWVKWRELTLSYNFKNQMLKEKIGFESAQLSLTGRNLWFWNESDIGIDPESNLTGASNGRGLQYFNNPVSKSYLVTLKLNF